MNRYPLDVPRNDVKAAVRWVEDYFATFGQAPAPDAMSVLLQLQDDADELEDALEPVFARHEPKPAEQIVINTDPTWKTDDDPQKLNRDLAKAAKRIRSGQ